MRKFFSIFFLIFLAIPTLVFSIFIIGFLKSIANLNVIDSLLTKTIQKAPIALDEIKDEIPSMTDEEKSQIFGQNIWMTEVLVQSDISFQKIFKQSQLNTHLSLIKTNVIKHLKGKQTEDLIIDTALVKNDLSKPVIKNSILTIIENLPKCTTKQKASLLKQALSGKELDLQTNQKNLCYLENKEINNKIAQDIQSKIVESIPNKYNFINSKALQGFYKFQNKTKFEIYLILIVPIIFFTLAGFLYSDNKVAIIRVISIAIFVSSLLSILLSKIFIIIFQKIPIELNESFNNISQSEIKIVQQVRDTIVEFSSILTNPIFRISVTIMIASIILFTLSFFIKQSKANKQIV
jgi:hypothetical protein